MDKNSFVWHPNTQMKEWDSFNKIVKARGMWLTTSNGNEILDGVASMWCNVWGHSNPELVNAIITQTKKIQHSSLFNLTNTPVEELAKNLIKINPAMHRVFFSDNGSSAMEISLKIALQYWRNIGNTKKIKFASLENGYHGDTFGGMSVGYIPLFFRNFKRQLFQTVQFPVPNKYRIPKGFSNSEYQNYCLEKMEKVFSNNDEIAALVMESGAQVAGGVIIYPKGFQEKIGKICKKNNVLLILDEVATGFGRLGEMIQYKEQKSIPDIVSFGKMMTGGYLTMAATLTNKKIYDSFLGEFSESKHLFHGHTYTGNPIAAAVANENLKLYQKNKLIQKIKKSAQIFSNYYEEIMELDSVGDIRHKGMLMGIELVKDKIKKIPINPRISINKIIFEEGLKQKLYLRTLGNIIMLVPPLNISDRELNLLLSKTIKTIKSTQKKLKGRF